MRYERDSNKRSDESSSGEFISDSFGDNVSEWAKPGDYTAEDLYRMWESCNQEWNEGEVS